MIRLLILATVANIVRIHTPAAAMSLEAVDFEVFGTVQGVFFRKYTKEQADKLGVRGWCKNTRQGTVVGHMQGPPQKVHQMVIWLRSTGSPNSIIDRVIYRNGSEIAEYTFEGFEIRKS
ncbi:acylphosphatase-2-like isoform X1 [Hyposmocoma kahamanoa]|uniref:acylphosphatase-2-like isoform X1 n=1 Tax=Hyposmocoma kahamanoa TaxID=1477025 RepID=UPI000E6D7B03|nr:acylphosphatase-2-like isoform X1 [Hyposmocoma kahamanoa]